MAALVSLQALPCPYHWDELCSMAPASSPLAAMRKGQGQLSYFHTLRVGSPTPGPSAPTLLCYPSYRYGPLSGVLQLVNVRSSSPALVTSATGAKECGGWLLLPIPSYNRCHAGPDLPCPCSQGLCTCTPVNSFNSTELPRLKSKACFPECCSW